MSPRRIMFKRMPFKQTGRLDFAGWILLVILAASAALAGSAAARAQGDKPAVQEPEYINHVFLLGADGKLSELEHKDLTYRRETHPHPFTGATATGRFIVTETTSTVRLAPESHFIVKVAEGVDPSTVVFLKPFVVEKQLRSLPVVTAKVGFWGSVKSTEAPDTAIAVTFKKYGKGSLEIIPKSPLAPGEYAFGVTDGANQGVRCFGVDAK